MTTRHSALVILGILNGVAFSQSPAEFDQYQKLIDPENRGERAEQEFDLYQKLIGPDAVKALEIVLEKPDEYSTVILYHGSGVAFKEKRLEDSAFLFYIARWRARFDKECFPPIGEGGNSPFTLYSALQHQYGSAINPAVMAEPQVFEGALARVKKWSPKASKEYDPGYAFTERKAEEDALAAINPKRTEFINKMSDLARLLKMPEYFAAFRVVQAYNLSDLAALSYDKLTQEAVDNVMAKRPAQKAYDKAMKTMERIEKEQGLEGAVSFSK